MLLGAVAIAETNLSEGSRIAETLLDAGIGFRRPRKHAS